MKRLPIAFAAVSVAAAADMQNAGFDADAPGAAPAGWTCGVTGRGEPKWTVEPAPARSTEHALVQHGSGTFPWCVKTGTSLTDGVVEARFMPISGREDQAGGVVWRWKDADNYYVARANALENNVSLYYTQGGRRNTLKYVDAPVARGKWHDLRVEFSGTRIAVWLDGKRAIDHEDSHITGPGAIGVWTKADSVTAFSGFRYAASPR